MIGRRLALFALIAISTQLRVPGDPFMRLTNALTAATSAKPTFNVEPVVVAENAGFAKVTITKSAAASSYSKVELVTPGSSFDTAKPGVDYSATDVIVTFGNNQLSATVSIPIHDNAVVGPAQKVFTIALKPVRNAALGNHAVAGVYINDNDVASPPPPPPPPPPVVCPDGTTLPAGSTCPTPPPPPPSSGAVCPVGQRFNAPTACIGYDSIVTAVQACIGRTDPAALIVGAKYKVLGLYTVAPIGTATPPPDSPVAGVVLNPVIDDGIHRGDGWWSIWVPTACVGQP